MQQFYKKYQLGLKNMQKLLSNQDKRNFVLATAFGLGLAPFMPGTSSALLGLGIHLAIIYLTPVWLHFSLILFFFVLFSWLCLHLDAWATQYWNKHDHKNFVLDEVAGYLCVPLFYRATESLETALWGFVLFRALDMIKIWPANIVDKTWRNKWGVLVDDLISAFYAAIILYIFM